MSDDGPQVKLAGSEFAGEGLGGADVDEPYETAVVIACLALLGIVAGPIAYIAVDGRLKSSRWHGHHKRLGRRMKWRGENAWWKGDEPAAQLARVAVVLWIVILVASIVQWLSK